MRCRSVKVNERALRNSRFQKQSLINQYTLDKQTCPASLEDLVAGYLKQVPRDAEGQMRWREVREDDCLLDIESVTH
jgi:hypothetical protein